MTEQTKHCDKKELKGECSLYTNANLKDCIDCNRALQKPMISQMKSVIEELKTADEEGDKMSKNTVTIEWYNIAEEGLPPLGFFGLVTYIDKDEDEDSEYRCMTSVGAYMKRGYLGYDDSFRTNWYYDLTSDSEEYEEEIIAWARFPEPYTKTSTESKDTE